MITAKILKVKIMLKYTLIILSLYSVCAFANPRGFNDDNANNYMHHPQGFNLMQKANTVNGIKDNAQDGDYVLLPGYFSEKINDYKYIFKDVLNNSIEINLNNIVYSNIDFDGYYFIWGKVNKNFFKTSVNVEYISTPRFESRADSKTKELKRQMLKERIQFLHQQQNE